MTFRLILTLIATALSLVMLIKFSIAYGKSKAKWEMHQRIHRDLEKIKKDECDTDEERIQRAIKIESIGYAIDVLNDKETK